MIYYDSNRTVMVTLDSPYVSVFGCTLYAMSAEMVASETWWFVFFIMKERVNEVERC